MPDARHCTPVLHLSLCAVALTGAALVAACGGRQTAFSEPNARAHVNRLAGAIGSRPAGTDANRRARDYLIEQLRFYGYAVRVQEANAERPRLGLTARVNNIIAILPGATPDALGLVAHYDSRATSPGAADDGVGVAVALECGRLLAARRERRHSIMVLLTDAEEEGLMGAAALVRDPEVLARLRAYVNLDAIGSDGPVPLFETGPGNAWLIRAWARAASEPRGGSYLAEVYRRLPSDTDFSVLKTLGVPGLNFAAVGDGYAYHTPRDTPERLTGRAIAAMGDAALAAVDGMERADLSQRSASQAVYLDVAGARAIVLDPVFSRALTVIALMVATVALARTGRVVLHLFGGGGVARTFAWGALGVALVAASLVGMTALLRESREVYHPWYAHPVRFWVLLSLTAVVVVELLLRGGERLRGTWRAIRHPSAVWMVTLACWIPLAIAAEALVPAAAYLWSAPLLALAIAAVLAPASSGAAASLAAVGVLTVSGTLWLPEAREILRFAVPMFGRLPVITPIVAYPVAMIALGVMIAPPILALDAALPPPRPVERLPLGIRRVRVLLTPALLVALSVAFAACYLAEAYTFERPLQRTVQYVADHVAGAAVWEIGGVEPGLDVDLARGAPSGWLPAQGPTLPDVRASAVRLPFTFRAPGRVAEPLVEATIRTEPVTGGDVQVEVAARTAEAGLRVLFVAPAGVVPRRSSLPGIVRDGSWIAAYAAAPAGVTLLSATFPRNAAARLPELRVAAVAMALPGGEGWLRQPPWLGSARTVWHPRSVHLVAPKPVATPAPLR